MEKIQQYKRKYLNTLGEIPTFKKSWVVWRPLIEKKVLPSPTGGKIFDLGDSLSEIFQANASGGRSQGELSGGGVAWECLITWYLNLLCWNTPILIMRQNKKFVPSVINNVTTVTISNNSTNTESDVIIFSIPDAERFSGSSLDSLNEHLKEKLKEVIFVNLQCKTNWNDNSQIPMLWDMIYNSESRLPNVSVGFNGVSPQSVKKFKYGFVSVPTSKKDKLTINSVAVLRVKNLTGGNYWGHASKGGIASNIKELPSRGFSDFFKGGVSSHLSEVLADDKGYLDEFLSLSW